VSAWIGNILHTDSSGASFRNSGLEHGIDSDSDSGARLQLRWYEADLWRSACQFLLPSEYWLGRIPWVPDSIIREKRTARRSDFMMRYVP